jgi:hypothetical protein
VAFQIPSTSTSSSQGELPPTSALTAILDALSTRLRARDETVSKLSNELADKEDDLNSTKAELKEAREGVVGAERDAEEVKGKLVELGAVVGLASAEVEGIAALLSLVETVRDAVVARKGEAEALEEQIAAFTKQFEVKEEQMKEKEGFVLFSLPSAFLFSTGLTVSARHSLVTTLELSVSNLTVKLTDANKKLSAARRLSASVQSLQQQATEVMLDVEEEVVVEDGKGEGTDEPIVEEVA